MLNAFGRDYEELGSSDCGLILRNSGKVKILWGKGFVDLLDSNGKLSGLSELESRIEELEKKLNSN